MLGSHSTNWSTPTAQTAEQLLAVLTLPSLDLHRLPSWNCRLSLRSLQSMFLAACSLTCDPLLDFIMPCIRLRIHCLPTVAQCPRGDTETGFLLPFPAVREQGERSPELDQADTLTLLVHKLWGTCLTFMPSCLRKTLIAFLVVEKLRNGTHNVLKSACTMLYEWEQLTLGASICTCSQSLHADLGLHKLSRKLSPRLSFK